MIDDHVICNPVKITSWASSATEKESGQTYGMTSAISTAMPKPIDLQLTKELEETMSINDVTETDEELNHRMEVLSRLNDMVKEWIMEISVEKNMSIDVAEQVGGKIYTFGSYRLGVHQRGADIDALCIAPRHIDRCDYFTSFYEKLKKYPEVKDLRAIEDAFVPVMKMNFDGIEIDLLFARLALKEIPDAVDLQDDMILKNLDQKCVRSLNGCRVTDEILRLVPNVETYRLALRAVKLWAKQHGVYSNVLGYLGGVSWGMLVARTCQLYPNAAAATIVQKFFLVFSQWSWPQPVLLKQMTNPNLNFPVWDPRTNLADRTHLMPIITPAYPYQNSTYNVSLSTRTVMQKKLELGLQLTEEIMLGRAKWSLLFEKPNFFDKYKHFLILIASSATKEEQLEWYGLVEAKIRHLVAILERDPVINLVHANPEIFQLQPDYFKTNMESYSYVNEDFTRPHSSWFIGIEFHKITTIKVNLTDAIQNFTNAIMRHAVSSQMYKESMLIEAKYVKKKNLHNYLTKQVLKRDRPEREILGPVTENGASLMLKRTNAEMAARSNPYTLNRTAENQQAAAAKAVDDATVELTEVNRTSPPVPKRKSSESCEFVETRFEPKMRRRRTSQDRRLNYTNLIVTSSVCKAKEDEIIDLDELDESDRSDAIFVSRSDNVRRVRLRKMVVDDSISIDLTEDGPDSDNSESIGCSETSSLETSVAESPSRDLTITEPVTPPNNEWPVVVL